MVMPVMTCNPATCRSHVTPDIRRRVADPAGASCNRFGPLFRCSRPEPVGFPAKRSAAANSLTSPLWRIPRLQSCLWLLPALAGRGCFALPIASPSNIIRCFQEHRRNPTAIQSQNMPGSRVQTRFSQAGHNGSDRDAALDQPRTYSWVQTPVEMRHQQSAPENIPPLPVIPNSLHQAPETTIPQRAPTNAEYLHDYKIDQSSMGTHPSQFAPYADATPIDQTPNPHTQWRTTPMPPSPGPIPNKADLASSYEPSRVMPIAPDENPLTPTSPNRPQQNIKLTAYPSRAATGGDSGYNNHYLGQAPDPIQQIKGGTWKRGLCDCGDVGTCCTGLFCPCILYGKTQYRLSQKSDRKDPTNMLGYEKLNGSCVAFAVLCGCNFILAAIQHTRVRKSYGIPGSVGSDCVRGLCCSCCTLAQDEKEIKYREGHRSGSVGRAIDYQYATPGGMSYAPPPK
jgi:Cys-rich protein (TIGR01571 family)